MIDRKKERVKSIELRKEGLSINEISRRLNVSKGSVSSWVRKVELTSDQKLYLKNLNKGKIWKIYETKIDVEEVKKFLLENSISLARKKFSCSRYFLNHLVEKYKIKCKFGSGNPQLYCQLCGKKNLVTLCHFCTTCTSRIRRLSAKIKGVKLLGAKCKHCGWETSEENYSAFEFHHTGEEEKEIEIGKYLNSNWNKVKKELEKCILLCSRCHRIYHSKYKDGKLFDLALEASKN